MRYFYAAATLIALYLLLLIAVHTNYVCVGTGLDNIICKIKPWYMPVP